MKKTNRRSREEIFHGMKKNPYWLPDKHLNESVAILACNSLKTSRSVMHHMKACPEDIKEENQRRISSDGVVKIYQTNP